METVSKYRRPELLRLFAENEYGRTPPVSAKPTFEIKSSDPLALGGRATRKQELTVYLAGSVNGPSMNLLVYLPNGAGKPVPAFLGLNFGGNQAVANDPGIEMSTRWMRNDRFGRPDGLSLLHGFDLLEHIVDHAELLGFAASK